MLGLVLGLAIGAEPLDVTWSAPGECPPSHAVQAAVEANLAREDFGNTLTDVRIEASVVQDPAGWVLHVSVELPDGVVKRELTAASCDELASAAGLIIAVALDPLRVDRVRPTPDPEPNPLPKAWANPPEPPPQPPDDPKPPSSPESRRLGFDVRAAGMLDVGSLGIPRGGGAVGFGLVHPWVRLDTMLLYWAPRTVLPFDEPRVGTRFQQLGVGARACLKPTIGAWEPSTCAGAEGGAAWGRGTGLETAHTTTLPWLTVTTGLEVAWVGRVGAGVFAGVDAQFHVVRPQVRVDGLDGALNVAPVGARALVGALFRMRR